MANRKSFKREKMHLQKRISSGERERERERERNGAFSIKKNGASFSGLIWSYLA